MIAIRAWLWWPRPGPANPDRLVIGTKRGRLSKRSPGGLDQFAGRFERAAWLAQFRGRGERVAIDFADDMFRALREARSDRDDVADHEQRR